jgi:hypothetical protein
VGPSHGCSGQLNCAQVTLVGPAKPSAGLRSRRNKKAIKVIVDILGLTVPYKVSHQLGTIGVLRCARGELVHSADEPPERFRL